MFAKALVRKNSITAILLLVVLLVIMAVPASGQAIGITERVSVTSNGGQGNGDSSTPSISADGRYVAFGSTANNLVTGDTNGYGDNFVHDRQTGQTILTSVASNGTQGNDWSSGHPVISADGRYVAFSSNASNLVIGDTNGYADVFVHDLQSRQTTRVSVSSNGTQGNNDSWMPSISADGRYVIFQSHATNLVSGDTNGYLLDVFVYDRQTGQATLASVSSDGSQSNGTSYNSAISADGRFVTFASDAGNLVGGDTNGKADVFVHDRLTGQTTRISVSSTGAQGNGDSSNFPSHYSISADGRYVVFASIATNLVEGDTNGVKDAFIHDRQTGQTRRISIASNGMQGNGDSYISAISADGRYVVFHSRATNLVDGDTNGVEDAFVRDTLTSQTIRISVSSDGTEENNFSGWSSISTDGRYVAFDSQADNLVDGDTNGSWDVFVRDMEGVPNFTVSGKVQDAGSNPIANVTVSTSSGSATTQADGSYSLTLSAGIYTLSVSKNGYTFSPERQTLRLTQNISYVDFIGVASGSPVATFLDLPFNYGGDLKIFEQATRNWSNGGGGSRAGLITSSPTTLRITAPA